MVDRVGVERVAESQGHTRVTPGYFPYPGSPSQAGEDQGRGRESSVKISYDDFFTYIQKKTFKGTKSV